jgi:hypothetical protein
MDLKKKEMNITNNGHTWYGYIDEVHKPICTFDYYEDEDGNIWLNSPETEKMYREKGYGTDMILAAQKEYGEVLFSSARKDEHEMYNPGDDYDIRYLDTEGCKFVKKLIKNDIIDKTCWLNPFEDRLNP